MNRRFLGAKGEDLALSHLRKLGYKLLDRNFSCPYGEIDLILLDKQSLVFVEVKTRLSVKYGNPVEAVTKRKLQSILTTANIFMKLNPRASSRMRVDVVAIELTHEGLPKSIRHLKNVTA